ncbi:MAG TPA: sialidase family protein [Rhodanobacteraceae bacterium]
MYKMNTHHVFSWRLSATLTLLLASALALPAWAGSASMHMAGMSGKAPLGAGATFGPNGRLWLATVHDGHVQLSHSDDFGKTFSTPVNVNQMAQTIYDTGENHPKVALGPHGAIYVTWSHPLPHHLYSGNVRFARSLDGGRHFSTPVTINHDRAPITHRFDALAVAGNGDIVIAWVDGRNAVAAQKAGKTFLGKSMYYTWSSDGGKTFAPDHLLMRHSCECCRIALTRAPDGRVAAFFRGVYGDNIRDHAFAWLPTDGQPAHPLRATFSHWQVAACPHQGPGLAIGANGTAYGVWYEASHGPAVWFGQLDPGHPPKHLLKLGGPGASHADVAVHGHRVWVTWNQVDAEGYRLMLRTSDDGGQHFGPERVIARSTASVYSPQLLMHDGRAYVAWNTADGFRLIAATGSPEASR